MHTCTGYSSYEQKIHTDTVQQVPPGMGNQTKKAMSNATPERVSGPNVIFKQSSVNRDVLILSNFFAKFVFILGSKFV
jgi:hypothetical protein